MAYGTTRPAYTVNAISATGKAASIRQTRNVRTSEL